MKALTVLAIVLLTALAVLPSAAAQNVAARSDPATSGQGGPDASPGLRDATPSSTLREGVDPYFSIVEVDRIRAAVRGQIMALASSDADAAFAFLAPSVQAFYAEPAAFLKILTRDLAPIMKAERFAFAEIDRDSTDAVQLVQFTGSDGAQWLARFTVERQPDGAWGIKRCLVEAGDLEPRV